MSMFEITGETSLCLIIGDPVAHSLSPRMHNAAYHAAGVSFVMAAARVKSHSLRDAIQGVRTLSIKGLACTMPHKVPICDLLDQMDDTAGAIGAVNTVVNVDDTLIGYNTDWLGILRPLEQRTSLQGKSIAILGAGGAAQAAVYACSLQGARVTIFNRTISKAEDLAKSFNANARPLEVTQNVESFDIIINTTAMGMGALRNEIPVDSNTIAPHQIIFETIYHPFQTKLTQAAQERGATCLHGLDMFLEQGAAQFELHTGVKAPRAVMKTILENASRS